MLYWEMCIDSNEVKKTLVWSLLLIKVFSSAMFYLISITCYIGGIAVHVSRIMDSIYAPDIYDIYLFSEDLTFTTPAIH